MRVLFLLFCLVLLSTFAPPRLHRLVSVPERSTISFTAVPLRQGGGEERRLGDLIYLGGWSIHSNDYRFGGISAIHVDESGVLAVSDAGTLFRFTRPDRPSSPSLQITPLPDGPGPPSRKSDRDSEAMVVMGKSLWIAFERKNAVWRYAREDFTKELAARPKAMRKWGANSGSEAMLRLPDGRFLIFSEGGKNGRTSDVLLFDSDPAMAGTGALPLRYRPPEGYRITDAAVLPDGRLLLLNRRFAWFEGMSATLGVTKLPKLARAAILEGTSIADLRAPVIVDNMEALSVTQEQGRTIVWIASDDNFNPLQRTLLLKFMLPD